MFKYAYTIAPTRYSLCQRSPQLIELTGLKRRLLSTDNSNGIGTDEQSHNSPTQKKATQEHINGRAEHSPAEVRPVSESRASKGKQRGGVAAQVASASTNGQTSRHTQSRSHSQLNSRSQSRSQPSGSNQRKYVQRIEFPRMPYSKSVRVGATKTRPQAQAQVQPQSEGEGEEPRTQSTIVNKDPGFTFFDKSTFERVLKEVTEALSRAHERRKDGQLGAPSESDHSNDSGPPRTNTDTRRLSDRSASRSNPARPSSWPRTRRRQRPKSEWLLPILRANEKRLNARVRRDPRDISLFEAEAKLGMATDLYSATFVSGKRRGGRGKSTERWRRKQAADRLEWERGNVGDRQKGKVRSWENGKRGKKGKGREEGMRTDGKGKGKDSFAQVWGDLISLGRLKLNEGGGDSSVS